MLQQEREEIQQRARFAEAEVRQLLTSTSWKVTAPMRATKSTLTALSQRNFRELVSKTSRLVWKNLPLNETTKQSLKSTLFSCAPTLLSWSQAYKDWKTYTANSKLLQSLDVVDEQTIQRVERRSGRPPEILPAKLIAFYLPQFHPIPENDAWWGEGFTEWANVRPAVPQFEGHHQPHVPDELGYYDLRNPDVQRRQVELARLYGVAGFCFYFYWFGGRRLLETPILSYLNNSELDLPFCLCWANENWSRRWDGLDHEVLMAQNHSEDDDLAFISHISQYLRDPRYIRINGKPLLLVYRPKLLPSASETAERWRKWCRENGIGEIYLAYTQSFEAVDPAIYGFDAAIEFPPNNSAPPNITNSVKPLRPDFRVTVYDWRIFVQRSRNYGTPKYKLFRSVCPSWDNTARRKNRSTVFLNSCPKLYSEWLQNAIVDTTNRLNQSERLIFINAWNEWAEGAHLEPDEAYGYAWLEATRQALESAPRAGIVVVTHDGHLHGAQLLAYNLAKSMKETMAQKVAFVCLGDGPMKDRFRDVCDEFHDLTNLNPQGEEARSLARSLKARGFRSAIVNTTVAGRFLATLAEEGVSCISLIHELSSLLKSYNLQAEASLIADHARSIVFPAKEVREAFETFATFPPEKAVVRPQGLYKRNALSPRQTKDNQAALAKRLSIPLDLIVVLGVGYADHRKGIDLFVKAGIAAAKKEPRLHFVWVGHWCQEMRVLVDSMLSTTGYLISRFHFVGRQENTDPFYAGAQLYALTSREDPYPSTLLEAMDAGVPLVGFHGAGGFEELVLSAGGRLVPFENVDELAAVFIQRATNPDAFAQCAPLGRKIIQERFDFRRYIFDLLAIAGVKFPSISVIVPNYNYERFIAARLESILQQTVPIREIIFLDDASQDNSVAIAREILERSGIPHRIVVNGTNSGSVFLQWKKGIDLAEGDYVWVAEADDLSKPQFLETVVSSFSDPEVVLSYCQSKQMAQDGSILCDNYLDYVKDVSPTQWRNDYVRDGIDEIKKGLSIKNTIPNVSAVVFKRGPLKTVLTRYIADIAQYRVAGDWATYVHLLQQGRCAFHAQSLNLHRRHEQSVTLKKFGAAELHEIQQMQSVAGEGAEKRYVEGARAYIEELRQQFGLRTA